MTCQCKYVRTQMDERGTPEIVLSAVNRQEMLHMAEKLRQIDGALDVTITKHRNKRSLNANDYCWVLCTQIADKLRITKEDVYRRAIKDVGVYEPLPIRNDTVDKFSEAWATRGVGWFAEVIDDSKIPDYKLVFAYYGSSTYDTQEMSRLIDNLVQDAKSIGIDVMSDKDLALLKEGWR